MIDLRSDTVTRPSPEMLAAMMQAETGDDVYGEDPTVNRLESKAAAMTGKQAGLFVTSGTQGNLLALLSHCERGDEYIAGQDAHTYRFEAGGGAVLGSIQPQPLPFNARGELPLDDIRRAVKPNDFHFARTRLVCLENTMGGRVLPMSYLADFRVLMDELGLKTHLDGARVFNAAIALGVPVSDICQPFDTVSFCLSKGLAAPAGSVLVGDEETIARARRYRKMLGGGMRQAGILAAAGIHALDHHIERLAEDHEHARLLADAIGQMSGLALQEPAQTNMVKLDIAPGRFQALKHFMADHGVTVSTPRLVLHRDIARSDVERLITLFRQFDAQQL